MVYIKDSDCCRGRRMFFFQWLREGFVVDMTEKRDRGIWKIPEEREKEVY